MSMTTTEMFSSSFPHRTLHTYLSLDFRYPLSKVFPDHLLPHCLVTRLLHTYTSHVNTHSKYTHITYRTRSEATFLHIYMHVKYIITHLSLSRQITDLLKRERGRVYDGTCKETHVQLMWIPLGQKKLNFWFVKCLKSTCNGGMMRDSTVYQSNTEHSCIHRI